MGEEAGIGGGVVIGEVGDTKFFEIFFIFEIFYMVPVDSFVTFSPNLSKFPGRGGGSVR